MKIHIIAVGQRMPAWVEQGYLEYAKRLPNENRLLLKEIAPAKRGKNTDISRVLQDEGERMLSAIPRDSHVIALDVKGRSWTTEQLAEQMADWQSSGRDVVLLIGGPDGLSDNCLARASESWSLSALTYPHPLVRVIVAEQLYRAWSILHRHPYHRA